MYETIVFERDSDVATIALNRPQRLNAFDGRMHEELHDVLEKVASDDEVRCVVLRGEGRGFSAGADLSSEDLSREGGEAVDAEEAHRIGLVSRVVPDETLARETARLAERLAALPTKALAQTKSSLHASFENDLGAVLEMEARGQAFCGYSSDHEEGVAAFFEKRAPDFTGR